MAGLVAPAWADPHKQVRIYEQCQAAANERNDAEAAYEYAAQAEAWRYIARQAES